MDDLVKTLKAQSAYSPYSIANATLSMIKQSAGVLHSVNLGMLSCPTLTLYDNASGASGTILALIEAGATQGCYVYDVSFVNGLSAWVTQTGKVPTIPIAIH